MHANDVQRLNLELMRPAATVEAPATVTVTRTRTWPWDIETELPTVRLVERSGQRLSDVEARQTDTASGGVVVFTPPLTVAGAESSVIPPLVAWLSCATRSRTWARILSHAPSSRFLPQLAQPAKIAFTIETRWHWGWIAVWALLGVGTGWLLRTKIAKSVEVRNQRLQALRLEQLPDEERLLHQDYRFRQKLDDLRVGLQRLRSDRSRWGNAGEIKKIMDEIPVGLQAARTDLAERRTEVGRQLDALRDLTASRWTLPAAHHRPQQSAGSGGEGR